MTITQQSTALATHLVDRGATRLAIGRGRTPEAEACATSLIDTWTRLGGQVGAVVAWRSVVPAPRDQVDEFLAADVDAWVIADTAASWRHLAPLFWTHPRWDARRTFGFSGLGRQSVLGLPGPHQGLDGLRGVTSDGRWWSLDDGAVVLTDAAEPPVGARSW